MIVSFRCAETEKVMQGIFSRKLPHDIQKTAFRKLMQLDAALKIESLRSLPGNRLEALKGNLVGQYSIRINNQWRICFRWNNGNVEDVEIVDYH